MMKNTENLLWVVWARNNCKEPSIEVGDNKMTAFLQHNVAISFQQNGDNLVVRGRRISGDLTSSRAIGPQDYEAMERLLDDCFQV